MARKPIQRGNGQGSVSKLSGKRRKPFVVRVTLGWTNEGKQIRQVLGTYATHDEALTALINYNTNPYDIQGGKATFADIFDKWSEQKFPTISQSNITGYRAAYNRCACIANKPFKDIGLDDLQFCIDTAGCNYPTLKKIKVLMNQLYAYAIPRELTDKDYSKYVDIKKHEDKNPNKYSRNKYSDTEIAKFWSMQDTEIGKIVLMLIYSGMRISELLNLKRKDCHIPERFVNVVKSKTENGIRSVPLSEKVIAFWEYFEKHNTDNEYLIIMDGRNFEYEDGREGGYHAFRDTYFKPFMESLGMEKRHIHETRHTCASLLESKDVSQPKINRILGHTGKTTAENVYMHLDISDLIEAINLI